MAHQEISASAKTKRLLRDSARKFLARTFRSTSCASWSPRDHVEAYESATPPLAHVRALWKQIVDLGWTGSPCPKRPAASG
jgi:alkylation response protein AidB-like acyl-CoA dehydrogenase